MANGDVPEIPVLRPLLPTAARLLPHLSRIDASRCYTNWGPLVTELETRLASHFNLPSGVAMLTSSGTSGLVGAVLAAAGRATAAAAAFVPGFTFVATALAAEQCGFRPHIVDVDAETWSLDVRSLERHRLLSRVGLVLPVAPFGRAVPQGPWVEFRRRTGIPVVIDGGASFEAIAANPPLYVGPIPVVLSLHATKSFSTAEGGCVLTTDPNLMRRAGEALNFGFSGGRRCKRASTNGKMSEYHAAIGLAELDGWADKRSQLLRIAQWYRAELGAHALADRLVAAPSVASCYVLFECRSRAEASRVAKSLTDARAEWRLWYGQGLHHHPYFSNSTENLSTTDELAPRLIGLPVAPDLPRAHVRRIVRAVAAGLLRRGRRG